jgi:hypothetical protein
MRGRRYHPRLHRIRLPGCHLVADHRVSGVSLQPPWYPPVQLGPCLPHHDVWRAVKSVAGQDLGDYVLYHAVWVDRSATVQLPLFETVSDGNAL